LPVCPDKKITPHFPLSINRVRACCLNSKSTRYKTAAAAFRSRKSGQAFNAAKNKL
jgi:hypothetical protein